jgi:hypothetical protein
MALGPKSQQQLRNLVFCCPEWIITMATLNRNYEFKKSVIIECKKSVYLFVYLSIYLFIYLLAGFTMFPHLPAPI